MKIIKLIAAATCLLLFAVAACRLKQPILYPSYVDSGNILQWPATGQPFQIYWQNAPGPCLQSDNPMSNGRNSVVCHAVTPGSYKYDIDKPPSSRVHETQIHTGVLMMHVGTCTNCSGVPPEVRATPPDKRAVASSGGEVDISCSDADNPTTVNPPAGPSGLKPGADVTFYFTGKYISGKTPMTLNFSAPDCSNNPNPTQPFTITGNSGYCEVATSPTITYYATSNDCAQTKATLSVSPQQ